MATDTASLVSSARPVQIDHTCAPECGTSPWVPIDVDLRPMGNRGTRKARGRALSLPDRLQDRDGSMPCGRCNEYTQLHSRMRRSGGLRSGHRHGSESRGGRG